MKETEILPIVAVLMSTYNGEKFIQEQLNSILMQNDVLTVIYIRDDGSTDNTVEIINDYIEKHTNIQLIQDNKNLGPGMSFMTLLEHVVGLGNEYNYYAFSDQDDVWLKEKLIRAINLIKNIDKPALYCSNQLIYRNGIIEGKRYETQLELTLKGNLTRNLFSGCTYVFDQRLARLIVSLGVPDKNILVCRCHDSWVTSIALLAGKVVYDHKSFIKYRIHNDNAVGIKKESFLKRLRRFVNRQTSENSRNISMRQARILRDMLADHYSEKDRFVLDEFADYQDSLGKRLKLMFDKMAAKNSGQSRLIFMLKVLFGYI